MRKQIWIPCIIVLIACLLLLFRATRQHTIAMQDTGEIVTNEQTQSAQIRVGAKIQIPSPTQIVSTASGAVSNMPPSVYSNPFFQKILPAWQMPIEFYGKIEDENSNSVAGANITFGWSEFPTEEGARRSTAISDTDGLFSLHNKRGPSLDVWVSKEGYYASHGGQKAFDYMGGINPDPQNPVVFFLRKKGKGEALIENKFPAAIGQIWQLHHDGTPIELDLLNGGQASAGNGQLKLELWRDISDLNKQPFDWKLQITAAGGGLVPTDEEFPFTAPQSGYQTSIVIDMPATNQNWQSEIRNNYYLQLPNGKYGRISLYLLARNGVFTVQSAINPTGSRNLEPQ
jgi:hypothetical protein